MLSRLHAIIGNIGGRRALYMLLLKRTLLPRLGHLEPSEFIRLWTDRE